MPTIHEFLLMAGCLVVVVGLGHLPMMQAIFWFCDERENREVTWNMDFLLLSLAPVICLVVAVEIYFLFFHA